LLTPSPVVLATLSLHDALPICIGLIATHVLEGIRSQDFCGVLHELATFVIGHPTICKECEKSGLKVRILAEVIGLNNFVHDIPRSEEHTSELQSRFDLVCRLLL